jgi:hypothetical protein
MDNPLFQFLEKLDGASFREPTAEETAALLALTDKPLPSVLTELYTRCIPAEEIECAGFVFYGIDRIVSENRDYIPGANLLPFGLLTFASGLDGDSVSIDLNAPDHPVYLCPHEQLGDEDAVYLYENGETQELPFTYENILRVSHRMADSFTAFLTETLPELLAEELEE